MEVIVKGKIEELDSELISKIQAVFDKKAFVELKIYTLPEDETEYLLSTPENRESLFRSLEQYKNNQVVNKTLEELRI